MADNAAAASSSSASWLRAHRIRYLVLFLCSPIILPLLCASFPFLCLAELCRRLCCRSRRSKIADDSEEDDPAERLRRCEEGRCGVRDSAESGGEEVGLLQRYLEDQLLLVGSMYDCGDDDEIEDDSKIFSPSDDQSRVPLLN